MSPSHPNKIQETPLYIRDPIIGETNVMHTGMCFTAPWLTGNGSLANLVSATITHIASLQANLINWDMAQVAALGACYTTAGR